jgi:hypothetical protein
MTKINPALAGSAVLGCIAALVAIFALVPATQAEPGWRDRSTPSTAVMAYFDQRNELVRFYVGGKEVAILNGAGVLASHPAGR